MESKNPELNFLGREFLTWLWYKSQERDGSVHLPGSGDLEVVFLKRMVLESGEGEYSESVQCQGLHSDLKEGLSALRQGKKVKEARIRLGKERNQWEFTFKADEFRFQSVSFPRTAGTWEKESDWEGLILERIALLEELMNIMEALFHLFLSYRYESDWEQGELARLKRWIRSG